MFEKTKADRIRFLLLFGGPTLMLFVGVLILPLLYGVYLTFTDWNGISSIHTFVFFENYKQVFKDTEFWNSLVLTLKYVLFSVVFINFVAFVLSYFLTKEIKGQNIFRAGFFTPNLIGGVILGFIWKFVFSNVLVSIGQSSGLQLFQTSWLSEPTKAFWAFVIVTVWQNSGYMMLIYIAGFTSVPKDLVEAVSIDGCTAIQKLRYLILPMMVPSFIICFFLSILRCFMVYDLNLSFTGGQPYGTTKMVAMHVYQKAFTSRQYGVGQAEALILFLISIMGSKSTIFRWYTL